MTGLTPRSEALAFRIWAHCEPLGWDVTYQEVGDALDVSWHRVNRIAQAKGWLTRFRKVSGSHDYMDRISGNLMPGVRPEDIASGRVGMEWQ